MRYSHVRILASFLIVSLLLFSCATRTAYYTNLTTLVKTGQFQEAVAFNEKSKEDIYGKKNALLYYLDRGLLLHYSGNYAESNRAFETAKRFANELFTKSVTTEASTLLVSDNMRPYYGEDFERALIHAFSSLNYVFLGQEQEALVEARQVDHLLKTLNVNFGYKNVYQEDAFVRYLMGMLYENTGQTNDAFISYRQAIEAYGYYGKAFGVTTPNALIRDALRTARKLGFTAEAAEIEKKWGVSNDAGDGSIPGGGELVVVHYNGVSPAKIDHFIELSFGRSWVYVESMDVQGEDEEKVEQAKTLVHSIASEDQVRMAFPKYVPEPYDITAIEVSVTGPETKTASGVLVENVGAIAVKSLEDRIGRIRARTIARAAIKYVLAKAVEKRVEKSSGELSAWLAKTIVKSVSAATELSDKRSWRSLPDTINIVRLPLAQGAYAVQMRFLDKSGRVAKTISYNDIQIQKGKKAFLAVRTAA